MNSLHPVVPIIKRRMVDEFGFMFGGEGVPCQSINGVSIPDQDKYEKAMQKWNNILHKWDKYKNQKYHKVKGLAREGIPKDVRPEVWQKLTQTDQIRQEGYFKHLLSIAPPDQTLFLHIENDVPRTYPDHVWFRDPSNEKSKELACILKAYVLARPDIGYSEGMGRIAGMLLLQMPVEDAFYAFTSILHTFPYFHHSYQDLKIDCLAFDVLLQEHLPKLSKLFKKHKVQGFMYLPRWWMSGFTYLPWATVLRIWDYLLVDGPKAIFRISLALLKSAQITILSYYSSSSAEILSFLINLPPGDFQAERLLDYLCPQVHLSTRELESARDVARDVLTRQGTLNQRAQPDTRILQTDFRYQEKENNHIGSDHPGTQYRRNIQTPTSHLQNSPQIPNESSEGQKLFDDTPAVLDSPTTPTSPTFNPTTTLGRSKSTVNRRKSRRHHPTRKSFIRRRTRSTVSITSPPVDTMPTAMPLDIPPLSTLQREAQQIASPDLRPVVRRNSLLGNDQKMQPNVGVEPLPNSRYDLMIKDATISRNLSVRGVQEGVHRSDARPEYKRNSSYDDGRQFGQRHLEGLEEDVIGLGIKSPGDDFEARQSGTMPTDEQAQKNSLPTVANEIPIRSDSRPGYSSIQDTFGKNPQAASVDPRSYDASDLPARRDSRSTVDVSQIPPQYSHTAHLNQSSLTSSQQQNAEIPSDVGGQSNDRRNSVVSDMGTHMPPPNQSIYLHKKPSSVSVPESSRSASLNQAANSHPVTTTPTATNQSFDATTPTHSLHYHESASNSSLISTRSVHSIQSTHSSKRGVPLPPIPQNVSSRNHSQPPNPRSLVTAPSSFIMSQPSQRMYQPSHLTQGTAPTPRQAVSSKRTSFTKASINSITSRLSKLFKHEPNGRRSRDLNDTATQYREQNLTDNGAYRTVAEPSAQYQDPNNKHPSFAHLKAPPTVPEKHPNRPIIQRRQSNQSLVNNPSHGITSYQSPFPHPIMEYSPNNSDVEQTSMEVKDLEIREYRSGMQMEQ
ncbi:rab-GTPase-TBC domain-containing protein [Paraphysoderma sedebokerense]|nr:rab-GTPase-TBC domain-containing protein [Paraphysoderma sedebokerense]